MIGVDNADGFLKEDILPDINKVEPFLDAIVNKLEAFSKSWSERAKSSLNELERVK